MTHFIVRYIRSGEQVVAQFYARLPDGTEASLGTLRMDEPAWKAFVSLHEHEMAGYESEGHYASDVPPHKIDVVERKG